MSSKTSPLRLHVAMLNSLRAIDMLGGSKLQIIQIEGQFSRRIHTESIEPKSQFMHQHFQSLQDFYAVRWKAKGDDYASTINDIIKSVEKDGCPDIFLKSLTTIMPFRVYDEYDGKFRNINVPFIFHPHPFKPSVFQRLKGRMPSLKLYSRMKEIRKNVSQDLDDETKKRWRDILLINYPHEKLDNSDIRSIWQNEPSKLFLKETHGKFSLMEVDETI